MILSMNGPTENELVRVEFRVAQLEMIIRELLVKNEQLRMVLRSAGAEAATPSSPGSDLVGRLRHLSSRRTGAYETTSAV